MVDANSISKTEYDKGFLACILLIERIKIIDLGDIRKNRKGFEEYSPSRYGSGVWGEDW